MSVIGIAGKVGIRQRATMLDHPAVVGVRRLFSLFRFRGNIQDRCFVVLANEAQPHILAFPKETSRYPDVFFL